MKETGPLSLLRAKGRTFPLAIKCLYVTDAVLRGMKNEKHMTNRIQGKTCKVDPMTHLH